MDQEKCEVCSQDVYRVYGAWTELELSFKDNGEFVTPKNTICAYGDGEASMPMHYCPNCGRKLD